MTNSCTHTDDHTICDTCMGRKMEAKSLDFFIETAWERAVGVCTGTIEMPCQRAFVSKDRFIAALTEALAQGRRDGLDEAAVIAEGSRIIPVMREATSYYNAACLDVAKVIRQRAQAGRKEAT